MSIQLHVKEEDLPVEWKQEIRHFTVNDCERDGVDTCPKCLGEGSCELKVYYLAVQFPRSGWCSGYGTDGLVFDNKNANHQFREELDEWNVPYIRG